MLRAAMPRRFTAASWCCEKEDLLYVRTPNILDGFPSAVIGADALLEGKSHASVSAHNESRPLTALGDVPPSEFASKGGLAPPLPVLPDPKFSLPSWI
jgi:hypothetical protein